MIPDITTVILLKQRKETVEDCRLRTGTCLNCKRALVCKVYLEFLDLTLSPDSPDEQGE